MRFIQLCMLAATVAAIPLAQEPAEQGAAPPVAAPKAGKSGKAGLGGKGSKGSAPAQEPATPATASSGSKGKGAAQPKQGGGLGGGKVHLIFARGTTEPGTMGIAVGPALSSALSRKFGIIKIEGVPYPADISGAFSGGVNPRSSTGAIKMAEMAKRGLQAGSKVVLAGYSQGAEQVHGALLNLGGEGAKIAAAVTFGDPLKVFPRWGSLPTTRTKIFCTAGDGVCGGAFSISAAHMAYATNGDIGKAVAFIAEAMGK